MFADVHIYSSYWVENGTLCVLDEAIVIEHTTYSLIKENRKDIPFMPPDLAL